MTPFPVTEEELPSWLRRLYDVDVRPVVRLLETRWEDDTLVLRGLSFLAPVPHALFEHRPRPEDPGR